MHKSLNTDKTRFQSFFSNFAPTAAVSTAVFRSGLTVIGDTFFIWGSCMYDERHTLILGRWEHRNWAFSRQTLTQAYFRLPKHLYDKRYDTLEMVQLMNLQASPSHGTGSCRYMRQNIWQDTGVCMSRHVLMILIIRISSKCRHPIPYRHICTEHVDLC